MSDKFDDAIRRVNVGFAAFYGAISSLSISECDFDTRWNAMNAAGDLRDIVLKGIRAEERRRDREAFLATLSPRERELVEVK